MPVGRQEDDDQHAPGVITDKIAKSPSSKTDTTASNHPAHIAGETKGDKVQFRAHDANPGPAVPENFNAQQEGTKQERQAKAKELNK